MSEKSNQRNELCFLISLQVCVLLVQYTEVMKGVILGLVIGLNAVFYCVALNCYDGQVIFADGKEQNGTRKQPKAVTCPTDERFCVKAHFKEGRLKDSQGQKCDNDRRCYQNGCTEDSRIVSFQGIYEVTTVEVCCCSTDLCNSSKKLRYEIHPGLMRRSQPFIQVLK
ncbi:hypothetical protein AB6A40_002750 [Gnathostoma spinigerum]|uniref:UPAR/Ly6 domain-containing protein n=1 Tax=Gnathostoma spinigerum TaxID=75299 RepID=A0ABD6E8U8_9BILA